MIMDGMSKIIACLTLVLFFVLTSASAATTNPVINTQLRNSLLSQGYFAIPLHLAEYSNTLLIEIQFNNGKHYPLILDTGAAFSTIEQRYANQLNAKITGADKIIGGVGGKRAKAYQAVVPTINLSHFTSHNEIFYLSQNNFSSMQIDKQPIVGLLGLDYLMKHQAIIDIAGQQLYLRPTNRFYDQPINFAYKAIPLHYTLSGLATVMASVNNSIPARFLLDTGVPVLMISTQYAKSLGLKHATEAIIGKGSGGADMLVFPTTIKQFTVDGINSLPKETIITNFKFKQVGVPILGVIGLDWLQTHHAIIDMENDVVYVD